MPIAPDGGPTPGFAAVPPTPAPAAIPETWVCMRGPCRHFWHLVSEFPAGNPESTWAELNIPKPRQHSYSCLVQSGMEFDFGDEVVFECSRWDPLDVHELDELERRRELYQIRVNERAARMEAAIATEPTNPAIPVSEEPT